MTRGTTGGGRRKACEASWGGPLLIKIRRLVCPQEAGFGDRVAGETLRHTLIDKNS